jgi:hypothetical protein
MKAARSEINKVSPTVEGSGFSDCLHRRSNVLYAYYSSYFSLQDSTFHNHFPPRIRLMAATGCGRTAKATTMILKHRILPTV